MIWGETKIILRVSRRFELSRVRVTESEITRPNYRAKNGPYAWLRQTNKFHHQASFARKILCICTICAWVFFSNLLRWDILLCKTSQLYNSKRGLVEKFAHLTSTCIRAIRITWWRNKRPGCDIRNWRRFGLQAKNWCWNSHTWTTFGEFQRYEYWKYV